MNALRKLLLPGETTEFEEQHLQKFHLLGLLFFAAHIPVFTAIAFFNDTGPLLALVLTSVVVAGPWLANKVLQNPRNVSLIYGCTSMLIGGLLVHFGQGPVQIEMHFYFFASLAMLTIYGNPMVIIAAAITVTVHHLGLWAFLPQSIFNYEAPFWVVAVHAIFVVLESCVACYMSRSFFDNVIGLEKIVQARTAELDKRNDDMRLVLDHVDQGLLTLDLNGYIHHERSAAVEHWLGTIDEDQEDFATFLDRIEPGVGDYFRLGWEEVTDGFMPLELTLGQLVSSFHHKDRTYHMDYIPIMSEKDELTQVLVVITDTTARIEQERLEAEQREVVSVFDQVMRDRNGFMNFHQEANRHVQNIIGNGIHDIPTLSRIIHTLKGNTAIFGLQSISTLCHHMETTILEEGVLPTQGQRDQLAARWESLSQNMNALLGEDKTHSMEITNTDYMRVYEAAMRKEPYEHLTNILARWKLEPTEHRLQRVGAQALRIAEALGKGHIEVTTKHNNLRLDPKPWNRFWASFIHVVRNAVDHGLETAQERLDRDKAGPAAIHLETRSHTNEFIIEISDNGKGIDWDKLRNLAQHRGLPHHTEEDLIEVMHFEGVSTANSLTEVSGRGIGLSAVQNEMEALGGYLEVESKPGEGTTFQYHFPLQNIAARPTLEALLSQSQQVARHSS